MFEVFPRDTEQSDGWVFRPAVVALAVLLAVGCGWAEGQEPAEAILLDRPAVPVSLPRRHAEPAAPRPNLPPEGTQITEVRAGLLFDASSGWHVLEFQDQAVAGRFGSPRVLPCRLLQRMEQLLADGGPNAFLLSGETTAYQDATYVLLRNVAVVEPASAPGGPPPEPQPASSAATGDGPLTAQGVAERLLSQKRQRRLALPVDEQSPGQEVSAAPSGPEALPPERGNMIVDRLVRVLPDSTGAWWEVRFEADNSLGEPPLRVLPGRFLQVAQKLGGKLRITGEMTHYKGQSYILLRKVLRERQLGQF